MANHRDPLPDIPIAERDGSPSAIARDALRQLAAMRMPPTPDNFARIYYDLAAGNRPVAGSALSVLREVASLLAKQNGHGNGAANG